MSYFVSFNTPLILKKNTNVFCLIDSVVLTIYIFLLYMKNKPSDPKIMTNFYEEMKYQSIELEFRYRTAFSAVFFFF